MAIVRRPGQGAVHEVAEKIRELPPVKQEINEEEIIKVGGYDCVRTKTQGVYKIVGKQGYIAKIDYGYEKAMNRDGKEVNVRKKTTKKFDTFEEALAAKGKNRVLVDTGYKKGMTLETAIDNYKKVHVTLTGCLFHSKSTMIITSGMQ